MSPSGPNRASKSSPAVEPLESRRLLALTLVGGEFQINTYTSGPQEEASVAMDADGNFTVVWRSPDQGEGIFARRYDASGVPLSGEIRVNGATSGSHYGPQVVIGPDGGFVVTWAGPAGVTDDIHARRFDAAGNPLGDEFLVNQHTTGRQALPAIAMDASGNFLIVWSGAGVGDGDGGIYARRFDASGTGGDEFRVNSWTFGAQLLPSVAMKPDGGFVLVWEDWFNHPRSEVKAQRYGPDATPQGSEFRADNFTTGTQLTPVVALDADGDFVVAWQTNSLPGGPNIALRRYSATGTAQGQVFYANDFTANEHALPALAMTPGGDFVVSWSAGSSSTPEELDVFARMYKANGSPAAGGALPVNSFMPGTQWHSTVAVNADGNVIVAWDSELQDGSNDGVFAQRVQVTPGVSVSLFEFNTAPHRVRVNFDDDVAASLDAADLVLENLTTMQTVPSDQIAVSYEPLANVATFSYAAPGGVLPDGQYRATLLAAGITNLAGVAMGADHVLEFFFLQGDATRDRHVNLNDFNVLAANFGQENRNFSQGDFTYDGRVNLDDFNVLAGRFGASLSSVPASSRDASVVEDEDDEDRDDEGSLSDLSA